MAHAHRRPRPTCPLLLPLSGEQHVDLSLDPPYRADTPSEQEWQADDHDVEDAYHAVFRLPRAVHAVARDGGQKADVLFGRPEAAIARADREPGGVMGTAIPDLTSGRQMPRNAPEVFPTASTIKIAFLQSSTTNRSRPPRWSPARPG